MRETSFASLIQRLIRLVIWLLAPIHRRTLFTLTVLSSRFFSYFFLLFFYVNTKIPNCTHWLLRIQILHARRTKTIVDSLCSIQCKGISAGICKYIYICILLYYSILVEDRFSRHTVWDYRQREVPLGKLDTVENLREPGTLIDISLDLHKNLFTWKGHILRTRTMFIDYAITYVGNYDRANDRPKLAVGSQCWLSILDRWLIKAWMIITGRYWLVILAPKSLLIIGYELLPFKFNNDNKIWNLAYYKYQLILILNYCKKKKNIFCHVARSCMGRELNSGPSSSLPS